MVFAHLLHRHVHHCVCRLFCLKRDSTEKLLYWSHPSPIDSTQNKAVLEDYFRLEQSVTSLYKTWSKKDENFSQQSVGYHGIRLLNQHSLETLVAFISSSNNNIERIHLMMVRLCQAYGDHIGCHGDHDYYTFPSLSRLCANGVEERLRDLGFGYRAKYISQTAQKLSKDLGGEDWLVGLKERPYLGIIYDDTGQTSLPIRCCIHYRSLEVAATVSRGRWESCRLCVFDGSWSPGGRASRCPHI